MHDAIALLRQKTPAAAELRTALAGLPLAATAAEVASIEALRRQKLLAGEVGPDLERVEGELAHAIRERDRYVAFREEMTIALAEAEQRESRDNLQAQRDAAEKEAAAVARLFERRYDAGIDELIALSVRLQAADFAVGEANRRASEAGIRERIADSVSRMTLKHALHHAERLRAGVAADNVHSGIYK